MSTGIESPVACARLPGEGRLHVSAIAAVNTRRRASKGWVLSCSGRWPVPVVPQGQVLVRIVVRVESIRGWLLTRRYVFGLAEVPRGIRVVGRLAHGLPAMLRIRRSLFIVIDVSVAGLGGWCRGYSLGRRADRLGEDRGVGRGRRRGIVGIRDSKAAQRLGQTKVATHCGCGRGR